VPKSKDACGLFFVMSTLPDGEIITLRIDVLLSSRPNIAQVRDK
jgi:hypothetical protein